MNLSKGKRHAIFQAQDWPPRDKLLGCDLSLSKRGRPRRPPFGQRVPSCILMHTQSGRVCLCRTISGTIDARGRWRERAQIVPLQRSPRIFFTTRSREDTVPTYRRLWGTSLETFEIRVCVKNDTQISRIRGRTEVFGYSPNGRIDFCVS